MQIYPKGDSGQGVTQDTPQGSVAAAQVDVDEVLMQDSEYLPRMINSYIKHNLLKSLFAFPYFYIFTIWAFLPRSSPS